MPGATVVSKKRNSLFSARFGLASPRAELLLRLPPAMLPPAMSPPGLLPSGHVASGHVAARPVAATWVALAAIAARRAATAIAFLFVDRLVVVGRAASFVACPASGIRGCRTRSGSWLAPTNGGMNQVTASSMYIGSTTSGYSNQVFMSL